MTEEMLGKESFEKFKEKKKRNITVRSFTGKSLKKMSRCH